MTRVRVTHTNIHGSFDNNMYLCNEYIFSDAIISFKAMAI